MSDRVKIHSIEVLSDNWYVLRKATFDYQRNNGEWQTQSREVYDRGNGATILLYNLAQQTVVLTRQFRFPAFSNGLESGLLIETAAGLLDQASPEERIRLEAEEETGYQVQAIEKVFEAYMSPGSVTEKLYFYIAAYQAKDKLNHGGGVVSEGEDIEVLELPFQQALAMVKTGEIQDGKTIILLQYAALHLF
ncbi:GDP-mannose pyrophosphatase NudK [uncultured Thiothrix sp.]|jgi:nudix-type nucleoside diphosphatase (YffH/AdpP family)|uniref:GDP-mannose pyrophosphatase NudK n=1 Tax=uncultured Thiothrix sp. TaxID=223185 RepID=UPI002628C049|nr:GDP-mannose pyrophosphatase NudK [uncultured Thiothrix sp.]HMT93940.1 GDP-mannose pyrophosphatase NudK [Thiolinea sp.]